MKRWSVRSVLLSLSLFVSAVVHAQQSLPGQGGPIKGSTGGLLPPRSVTILVAIGSGPRSESPPRPLRQALHLSSGICASENRLSQDLQCRTIPARLRKGQGKGFIARHAWSGCGRRQVAKLRTHHRGAKSLRPNYKIKGVLPGLAKLRSVGRSGIWTSAGELGRSCGDASISLSIYRTVLIEL